MARSCEFAVVKIAPDPIRDEALNGAVVIFHPDRLEVHLTPNPERLRTVVPSLHAQGLDELSSSLHALDVPSLSTAERIERLRGLPGIFVSDAGALLSENEEQLQDRIRDVVARMLTSIRAPSVATPKVTRLTMELVKTFRREKLLGRGSEAIEQHKIVRNIPVSLDGSLRADFVAKNRRMHVTETVDLRTEGDLTAARMKDIAVAAVTLDEARRHFGKGTQRYFIYAARSAAERQAQGYLQAAEHYTDHVFNFASKDDRATYLDFIFAALRGDLAGSARISGLAESKNKAPAKHPKRPPRRR
jgi:hypothetical protein